MAALNFSKGRWSILIGCLLLVLWSANPFKLYFANDDFFHVPESGHHIIGQTYLLRPVSELTLWLDYSTWQKNATGYHITNLLLHLLNTILIYFFIIAILNRLSSLSTSAIATIAWLSMLLFLINPSSIEAILWILGRGAMLATCFTLLSLICFLQGGRVIWKIILSLSFFTMSLLCYESSFITPLLITILAYAYSRKWKVKVSYFTVTLFWAILIIYLAIRIYITGVVLGQYEAGYILEGNWYKLLYNFNALIARSLLPPLASGTGFFLGYLLMFITGVITLMILRKTNRGAVRLCFVVLILFLVTLVPVISVGIDTHDSEGGRFLYLPSVFFLLLLVKLIYLLTQGRQYFLWMLSSLMVLYFAFSFIILARDYQVSAIIAKSTIQGLQDKQKYAKVFVIDLPSQYKGATIFRTGFDNAIRWMCPGLQYQSLEVLTQKEISKSYDSVLVKESSFENWLHEHPEWNTNKITGKGTLNSDQSLHAVFEQPKNLLLIWTDSSFTKVRN